MGKPNVLYVMTDQQRFDTIRALGQGYIYTPNLDRLVARGVTFLNAYSTCPVCVPARYTIRTGCEPPRTTVYRNGGQKPVEGQAAGMEERCGPYLARTMRNLGYRTFGIGKFHSVPRYEDLGYDVHLHSEELYGSREERKTDSYAAWLAREHPEYDWQEGLMGERTEMYYMPQMSHVPAECCVESWAADRAVEQLQNESDMPFFGFVSFIGPHPPCAPPVPFNRMYHPDRMPHPVRGGIEIDHMDEQIPWMNHLIWADDISDMQARALRARYWGEISFIDDCLGRILDAVEARGDADNTLIAFFTDHGDHLGDHSAWQKESFFESSAHIPFLVSWPERLPAGQRCEELACLTDLVALATGAAGKVEVRDGHDILGMLEGKADARESVIGYYGEPGTPQFKIMVRTGKWKYIYFANGGGKQIFNLEDDPGELNNLCGKEDAVVRDLHRRAVEACAQPNADRALEKGDLKAFDFTPRELRRIYQYDGSRNITPFPDRPEEVLRDFRQDAKASGQE